MNIKDRILSLNKSKIVSKDELNELISGFFPRYNDTSIRWVIYRLIKEGLISKLDSSQFIVGKSNPHYEQETSDERNKIVHALSRAFPAIRIVVYESTLLNEWVNHQIARNVIFVETEKYFEKDVFRFINNMFPRKTLLNPKKEDLSLYEDVLIIVSALVTQAPINQNTKSIKIEKLIVDLFTKDLITEFISEDEKEEIVEMMLKNYTVNLKTVYAYAKRRNNVDILKKVISNITQGIFS